MSPPSIGSERLTVQDPLINYAVEIGWSYISPENALSLRRGESGLFLYQTLQDRLVALNPGVVTMDNVGLIISRLESVRNDIEGNAEILSWLRGEKSIYVEAEKRQRNVVVVDFDHPSNNIFQVTESFKRNSAKWGASLCIDV